MPSKKFRSFAEETEVPVAVPGHVKRVAIIGGGASGAITLDSLVQENSFDEIVLFERRDVLGGIWVLDENPIDTPNDVLQAGETSATIDPPLPNPFRDGPPGEKVRKLRPSQIRFEQTPSYHGMTTNIIEKFMTYSDQTQWKESEFNQYVDRSDVRNYIEKYILRHKDNEKVRLSFKSTVEDVEKIDAAKDSDLPYQFKLTLRKELEDGTDEWFQESFDAIVVAVGHYHVPFIPDVPGLKEVQKKFPNVVQHAKFFTTPDPYKDKTIVVVGSRASGADLTRFAAQVAHTVYQSKRNWNDKIRVPEKKNIHLKPVIKKYEIENDHLKVVFNDGTEILDPDHIVYATGYQFSYPFLRREYGDITENGVIVSNIYQHTFLINEPLITMVGIPIDAISFRVFEYQAILVTRYLAGKVLLPTRKHQRQWLDERYASKGTTRGFHTIGSVDAVEYMRTLTELGTPKSSELPVGREFPEFTEEQVEEYKKASLKLIEFWDEPRIPV
ncbi:putative thiol-specific monooxygenase [Clavispora lusitaniae]|uniref:Thiol-specific monooxygenase n=1 Tax=Clavispora lusitaniae TaxID=36911 RepID=A0ACD0WKC8_CLALS|nr:hypothetical protein E0198_002683 [Clavispora lusitaniae]KAF7580211.1 Flavin-binding monooxygenase-like family protein [Clavispora lusitaniae]QFZ27774.1 putative thiol-specific monooxygenase [Clavispora lusitaniae]QFZ32919.1 putative thiol-specific monooxygenase [Clavispora lusitaniae]QFZ38589.1 putative thiol-specific monooxygenase [Clavispora lusitaniae]